LNLAKTLLLGLGETKGGTLMSVFLPLVSFGVSVSFVDFLLNYEKMHCLNNISLSLAVSSSQPDLHITVKNSQAANPNSPIWEISLAILLPKRHCLMNEAILRRKHVDIFSITS